MSGHKVGFTIKAIVSLALIVVIYVIDVHYFDPISTHNFLSAHGYLHKILLLVLVAVVGSYTFIAHPAKWTLILWLSCYVFAITGLFFLKILFLFINDPYHLQSYAFDFVQRYLLSFLPFLGLYILSIVVRGKNVTAK